MMQPSTVTVFVRDQAAALAFYTDKLGAVQRSADDAAVGDVAGAVR